MDLKNIINKTIAHRGIHNNLNIPENSIKAFQKALDKNLPIELDIHILKDNTLIVFHDDNLKRMTGINENIKDYTYNELNKLKLLNTNYKIPTLKEVLELVNGKVPIIIELKNDKRTNKMCNELVNELKNYKGEFIIQSFYPSIINWFKKNKPEYIRGLLISNNYKNKLTKFLIKTKLLLKYTSPNFLSVSKNILNNKKIQRERHKGTPVFVWTIKNKDEINNLKNKADAFISNNL